MEQKEYLQSVILKEFVQGIFEFFPTNHQSLILFLVSFSRRSQFLLSHRPKLEVLNPRRLNE